MLTVNQGTWSGLGNTYIYQWQRSPNGTFWSNVAGATSNSYTVGVADENDRLRIQVTAVNPDANVSAVSPATAVVPSAPPVNTGVPVISGTTHRGDVLTATAGQWSGPGVDCAYQWQRSANGSTWTAITGATAASYILGLADEGDVIRVVVTATNPDGVASVSSQPSATVIASMPGNTSPPTVSGSAVRAATLTSAAGIWTGNGNALSYQWQRSPDGTTWTSISGATDSAYSPAVADEGDRLRVLMTETNSDGSLSVPSGATSAVVSAPPVNTVAPSLSGATERTLPVTALTGGWTGAGNTYSYRWQRSPDGSSWTDIPGATALTYTATAVDEGQRLRFVVTAVNPDGSVAAASSPSSVVLAAPPAVTAAPSITGAAVLGASLSALTGTWSPGDVTFAYQWQRGTAAAGYVNIAGATTATYTLTSADVGQLVRVMITATNGDGSTSASSLATTTVLRPPANTVAPGVPSGTLMDSHTLTADRGTWDTATSYTYAWLRCPATATSVTSACTNVGTGANYTLTTSDIGSAMVVLVSGISAGGTTTAASGFTGTVVGQPLTNTLAPSISGTPYPPETLKANPGSWSVALTGIQYTWERCDADGTSNCTAVAVDDTSYVLSTPDEGHTIVLIANATSPGRSATATSLPLTVENTPLPRLSAAPTISGSATRGGVLTATSGSWTNSPTSLAYQWEPLQRRRPELHGDRRRDRQHLHRRQGRRGFDDHGDGHRQQRVRRRHRERRPHRGRHRHAAGQYPAAGAP